MTDSHDNALTQQIIGRAMRVHTRLGPGMLEKTYERCLCVELDRSGLPYANQVDMPLLYDGVRLDCGYRVDIIVRNEVLLELKSVQDILPIHKAQLLSYMKLLDVPLGLLINFHELKLVDGVARMILPGANQQPMRC